MRVDLSVTWKVRGSRILRIQCATRVEEEIDMAETDMHPRFWPAFEKDPCLGNPDAATPGRTLATPGHWAFDRKRFNKIQVISSAVKERVQRSSRASVVLDSQHAASDRRGKERTP